MSESKQGRSVWPVWLMLAMLPALYVLSIRPVGQLTLAGVIPWRTTVTLYHPILASHDYCPKWIWDAAAWYSGSNGHAPPTHLFGAAFPTDMLSELSSLDDPWTIDPRLGNSPLDPTRWPWSECSKTSEAPMGVKPNLETGNSLDDVTAVGM